MKTLFEIILVLAAISSLTPFAHAEQRKSNIIDFDADVIQGERRKPEIFIQVSKQGETLESVVYGRQDFNDFHSVDRVWRPSYYEILTATQPAGQGQKK